MKTITSIREEYGTTNDTRTDFDMSFDEEYEWEYKYIKSKLDIPEYRFQIASKLM